MKNGNGIQCNSIQPTQQYWRGYQKCIVRYILFLKYSGVSIHHTTDRIIDRASKTTTTTTTSTGLHPYLLCPILVNVSMNRSRVVMATTFLRICVMKPEPRREGYSILHNTVYESSGGHDHDGSQLYNPNTVVVPLMNR